MKRWTTGLVLVTGLPLLTFCGGEDEDDSGGSATEEVADSAEQPDQQAGRFSTPPDTTAPEAPKAFVAATGARLGEVAVVLGLPMYLGDYNRIVLRRAHGKTAPANCTSGTEVVTITDFSTNTYTDTGLFPGAGYSYRACIYDAADNVVESTTSTVGIANEQQRLFVTSSTYDGNLSDDFDGESFSAGIDGADARCQYHADQANLGGKWRAILSHSGKSARYHLPVYNGVYNMNGERLALTAGTFWDGKLDNAIEYDENGSALASGEKAWSSTSAFGWDDETWDCGGWSTTSSTGWYGLPEIEPSDSDPTDWAMVTTQSCSESSHLYCLESVTTTFTAPTVTVTSGSGAHDVDVTVDFSSTVEYVSSVQVRREAGLNFTNKDCVYNSSLRSSTVISYTGAADALFEDDTLTDTIDFDTLDTEHGYYQYFACVFDNFGNLRSISSADTLTVGSDFLRAFISTNTMDGSAMSQSAANTECTNSASSASLSGTFKAMVSDDSTSGIANVGTTNDRLVFDLDGNYAGYINDSGSGYFYGKVATTAGGSAVTAGTEYWTGSGSTGTYSFSACISTTPWNTNGSSTYGSAGEVMSIDTTWTTSGGTIVGCDSALRVACVEAN